VCLNKLHADEDWPRYEEVINTVEGFIYEKYGVTPERKVLYTGHAPFCAWALTEHGVLRLCLHCEVAPFTIVYYTDPTFLEHLKKYKDLWPRLAEPDFRDAIRRTSLLNDRFACIYGDYYSLCLSHPDNPSDVAVVAELLGKPPETRKL